MQAQLQQQQLLGALHLVLLLCVLWVLLCVLWVLLLL
jgi:hypothetical protein